MAKAIDRGLENREIVLGVLTEVLDKGNFVHLVLNQALSKYQYLEKPDRAFITRVTEGTLEYLLQIDYIINSYSKTKTEKMKPLIRNILRMSVYQLLYMDRVPDSAVCNEAVKLAIHHHFQGLKGFVNGVLRTIARNKEELDLKEPYLRYSLPQWMYSMWEKDWGKENAEKIAESFLKERPVWVRCNFNLASKEEILKIAVDGAKLLKKLADETEGNFQFEYSPESFTGTEPEYALEVCNAVLDVWQPTADNKAIINLPVTVEHSMPHVYASQVEYMCDNLKYRENVIVSLHPHNDRGCGVADSEMGLLAGADRIEGTLFGNGERTGNVDIVTLGMNMYSQGVDPKIDFSDMPHICEVYEKCTGMQIYERSPYSGALVFAAFSGSHQDAIAKGMHWRENGDLEHWTVPYLPIDPTDVGRNYDADVIRINSQSGKGGVGYILETKFGLNLPPKMREAMGYAAKAVSDHKHKELHPDEIFSLFKSTFENVVEPYSISEVHFQQKEDGIVTRVTSTFRGKTIVTEASGNGRLDAVSNALKKAYELKYTLETYQEHALEQSSSSKAIAYVGIRKPDGTLAWGAGVDQDIIRASIDALVTAINNR